MSSSSKTTDGMKKTDTLLMPGVINTDEPARFRHLNPKQFEAVTTKGPVLVIAGAGTGKTATMVHRVSYLIHEGVDPRRILLLTFTKKAATEMQDRVSRLFKNNVGKLVAGGTFHSYANNTLRQFANLIGIPVNFNILDTPDSEDVIDKVRTDLGVDRQVKTSPKKGRLYSIISASRNRQISIRQIIETEYTGLKDYISAIEAVEAEYKAYKIKLGLLDYDDLIERLVIMLKKNDALRQLVSRRFDFLMVDEFQDTNSLQLELVRLITPSGNNVMVVGDDMQSIYAFRGANHENILKFPQLFPGCKVITLEQNYRSQPSLLDFSNQIIANALTRYDKQLWSDKPVGPLPVVGKFMDAGEEAAFVADEIQRYTETGVPNEQVAVLTRNARGSEHVELELTIRGIPYVVVGGVKFIERKHVKDILAYLKIAHNMKDQISWHRVLKLLPGIGVRTAEKILLFLEDGNILEYSPGAKYEQTVRKLGQVINDIADDQVSLPEKFERIKSHYYPILESTDKDAEVKKKDIELLQGMSSGYVSLDEFLAELILNPPSKKLVNRVDPLIDETDEKPVTISTIHSAKGLEWHTVFVIQVLEGIIPSSKAVTEEEVEEERRMFYVACTRAKGNLYLTYPSFLPGYNAYFHQPSRFLEEIDDRKYLNINFFKK